MFIVAGTSPVADTVVQNYATRKAVYKAWRGENMESKFQVFAYQNGLEYVFSWIAIGIAVVCFVVGFILGAVIY